MTPSSEKKRELRRALGRLGADKDRNALLWQLNSLDTKERAA